MFVVEKWDRNQILNELLQGQRLKNQLRKAVSTGSWFCRTHCRHTERESMKANTILGHAFSNDWKIGN